jgi:hypothetical protein
MIEAVMRALCNAMELSVGNVTATDGLFTAWPAATLALTAWSMKWGVRRVRGRRAYATTHLNECHTVWRAHARHLNRLPACVLDSAIAVAGTCNGGDVSAVGSLKAGALETLTRRVYTRREPEVRDQVRVNISAERDGGDRGDEEGSDRDIVVTVAVAATAGSVGRVVGERESASEMVRVGSRWVPARQGHVAD